MCEGQKSWGKNWKGDRALRTHPCAGMKSLIVKMENGESNGKQNAEQLENKPYYYYLAFCSTPLGVDILQMVPCFKYGLGEAHFRSDEKEKQN